MVKRCQKQPPSAFLEGVALASEADSVQEKVTLEPPPFQDFSGRKSKAKKSYAWGRRWPNTADILGKGSRCRGQLFLQQLTTFILDPVCQIHSPAEFTLDFHSCGFKGTLSEVCIIVSNNLIC